MMQIQGLLALTFATLAILCGVFAVLSACLGPVLSDEGGEFDDVWTFGYAVASALLGALCAVTLAPIF